MAKVLVIEDEMPVRANIAELLEAEDFEVITAENGFIGVLWAQEHLPDLVICDVMMPELDGRDVLSALRQDPLTEGVPFIFLTARADKSDIRTGMDLGADDYLTKPFSRRELLGAVNARLSKYQSIERRYQKEYIRAESLKQKIDDLLMHSHPQDDRLQKAEVRCKEAVPKLKIAMNLLRKIPNGMHRKYCLQILQEIYNDEIDLLKTQSEEMRLLKNEDSELWQEFTQMYQALA